jgi:membrane-bound ClpP family serine protease
VLLLANFSLEENHMDIQVTTENGRVPVTVMHVDGNIDALTYEQFQAKAQELIDGGTQHLLIDLSRAARSAPAVQQAARQGCQQFCQ